MSTTPAKVRIHLPHGCDRRSLSIDALDKRTRELAFGTTIEIDGKPLYCLSFKTRRLDENVEVLVLEVGPECFEFLNKEPIYGSK